MVKIFLVGKTDTVAVTQLEEHCIGVPEEFWDDSEDIKSNVWLECFVRQMHK